MSNLFGTFFMVYMLIIVIHGSLYSNMMQNITKLKDQLQSKGANKKTIRAEINGKLRRVTWRRRIIWFIFAALFILHQTLIGIQEFPEPDAHLNASYLFVSVCVLLIVMNWLKGSGTIDKKVRFKESGIRK